MQSRALTFSRSPQPPSLLHPWQLRIARAVRVLPSGVKFSEPGDSYRRSQGSDDGMLIDFAKQLPVAYDRNNAMSMALELPGFRVELSDGRLKLSLSQ